MSETPVDALDDGPVTNIALLAAVKQLIRVVEALDRTLKNDYPKRVEVRRARRNFAGAVILALLLSYFATINTVSYCFLSGKANSDQSFCHIFPGYTESQDRNKDILNLFNEIVDTTHKNRTKIDDMQKQINDLKNGG